MCDNQLVNLFITVKEVLINDFVIFRLIAIQHVSARRPQILPRYVQMTDRLCMRSVKLKEVFAALGDASNGLTCGKENRRFLIAT